jgi:hypothetical protein
MSGEQLFGPKGPFVGRRNRSPSAVQQEMARLGLPIVSLKAAAVEVLQGGPILTHRDVVSLPSLFRTHTCLILETPPE